MAQGQDGQDVAADGRGDQDPLGAVRDEYMGIRDIRVIVQACKIAHDIGPGIGFGCSLLERSRTRGLSVPGQSQLSPCLRTDYCP